MDPLHGRQKCVRRAEYRDFVGCSARPQQPITPAGDVALDAAAGEGIRCDLAYVEWIRPAESDAYTGSGVMGRSKTAASQPRSNANTRPAEHRIAVVGGSVAFPAS